MEEIWKDVVGYEGLYKVSNLGRVYSLPRPSAKGGIKKQTDMNGYLRTILSKNGKKFNAGVHRLVAEAFIPNPENKPTVNHEDGNKHNNKVTNLAWATDVEQLQHSFKCGLRKKQCNIERKGIIIYPDNSYKTFDTLKDLSSYLGFTKSFCNNRKNKYGNIFYKKDLMIALFDRNEEPTIMNYQPPTIDDIPLVNYCELNNLNYSTIRYRIRNGWSKEKAINTPTKTKYVQYYKGGGANDV